MDKLGTIIGDHWRGALSPGIALAGPLLGLHLGLALLLFQLRGAGFHVVILLVAVQLGVLIWQSVGMFRVADRSLQGFGGAQVATLCYVAILGVVGSSLFQIAGLLAAGQTVTAGIEPPPATVSAEGAVIRLEGEITLRAYSALGTMLADEKEYRALVLTSDGGNIHAARGLARLVVEAGLETVVEGNCFSACTLVFIAGSRRVLKPGGSLGFHQYRLADFEGRGRALYPDARAEQQRDRGYFEAQGIASQFIDRIYQTDHDAIWRPSRQDLLTAGVLTN